MTEKKIKSLLPTTPQGHDSRLAICFSTIISVIQQFRLQTDFQRIFLTFHYPERLFFSAAEIEVLLKALYEAN